MSVIIYILKSIMSLLNGVSYYLFGKLDSLIYALIALTVIDYITGVILAIYQGKISSNIGFKGICKKVMMFALISLGNIMGQYVINVGDSLKIIIIMFYLSNEGISILENATKMGIPFPKKLKESIQQMNKNNSNK